ncbi:hypothetical protein H9P43_004900 [Blastocladiella emersonii ATCC 22665]|nr:hypothetical protein H9P43_004900 [Blastocladiella emersonii ATCC 22665]
MFALRSLVSRAVTAPLAAMNSVAAVATGTATRSLFTIWNKHTKDGRKTNKYQGMLKAKRRRQRRGKAGGPPRNAATFRTYAGFRKDVNFLPTKLGFTPAHLKEDPSLMVPIAVSPSVAPAKKAAAAAAPAAAPAAATPETATASA